jgi:hypothetical protein
VCGSVRGKRNLDTPEVVVDRNNVAARKSLKEQEVFMPNDSFFEIAKADIKNTIVSYFAPVRAVVNEISRAVAAETASEQRSTATRHECEKA